MTDEPKPPFPGWPGGYVPIIADANVGDDERAARDTNCIPTGAEFEKIWGPHPWADFKPVIRRKRRR